MKPTEREFERLEDLLDRSRIVKTQSSIDELNNYKSYLMLKYEMSTEQDLLLNWWERQLEILQYENKR